jgi:acetyl esterase/lipase
MSALSPVRTSHTRISRPVFLPVSPALKRFLESGPVGSPGLKSVEEWKQAREMWKTLSQPISDTARAQYFNHVEEKFFDGVRSLVATPKTYKPEHEDKRLVYIHGGAFTLGSPDHLFPVFSQISYETGLKVVAIDYSLAPEAPFPAGIDDCEKVVLNLNSQEIDSNNIALIGDSAGGNICLALTNRMKKKPAALSLFSPMTKGAKSESYFVNKDPRITYEDCIYAALYAYFQGDLTQIENPEMNILKGDLSAMPPIYTQTGTRDAIADDSYMLYNEMNRLGREILIDLIPYACHGIVECLDMLEAETARHHAAEFIIEKLGL